MDTKGEGLTELAGASTAREGRSPAALDGVAANWGKTKRGYDATV
jgi:hypothetical protein